jgi:ribosomal protein S12 methylthiotransferase
LDFVREMEFTHLGVFTYSPEEGTKAARMKDRPSPEVAEERRARIMELQQGVSWKRNKAMLGSIVSVLIDGINTEPEGMLQGRTAFQAPEIDGVVHITKGEAIIGEIVPVEITQAEPYDLRGEITRGC